jgi:acyl-CoA thioesterase-1
MIPKSIRILRWGVVLLLGCGRAGDRGAVAAADTSGTPGASAALDSVSSIPAILFLGTSLTAGLGLDPDSAFPALIQRKVDSAGYHYRVVNAGVSGETSAGAVRRTDWLFRRPPAILIIETGANDGLRGQDPDTLRDNLQAIIDRARRLRPEPRVILAGMEALPNLGADYARRFRLVYPEVARKNGVPMIPFLLAGVAGVDSLNQNDGIHPNLAGEKIVADNVWLVLRTMLKN